jgi:Flp pilus assembly protein CpaB
MVVSFFLWKKIQNSQQEMNQPVAAPMPQIPMRDVVVAKRRIPSRTRMDEKFIKEYLEIGQKNASDVPVDAFLKPEELTNKYTSMPILPGDVLTPDRILDKDAVPNVSFAIPQGKRAVTIQAGPIIGVAGFVQQGDFVDVIATFRPPGGQTISKLVLQDIQVMAVGKTFFQDLTTGSPGSPSAAITSQLADLITLVLSPEELEKLVYLDSGVQFRLVLKNPKDKGQTITTRGATEKIVMEQVVQELAKFSSPTAEDPKETPVTPVTPVIVSAPEVPMVLKPVDDGKVEIFYGRKIKEEVFKDGYSVTESNPSPQGVVSYAPQTTRPPSYATPYEGEE